MLQTKWSTFDRFQKVMLCILAAMALLFAVLLGISRGRPGVYFHDTLLDMRGTVENGAYYGRSHGEDVSIVVRRDSDTETSLAFVIGDIIHDNCLVEYPLAPIQTEDGQKPGLRVSRNGEVLFEGAYDPADYSDVLGYILYDESGEWTPASIMGFHAVTGSNYWTHYEPDVDEILRFANGPELVARGSWANFFMACLIALLAAVTTAFPYELFQLGHALRPYVKDPEPTEFYYLMTRVESGVLTVVALVMYIMALRTIP